LVSKDIVWTFIDLAGIAARRGGGAFWRVSASELQSSCRTIRDTLTAHSHLCDVGVLAKSTSIAR